MSSLLDSHRIVICVGSGGVGKTTTAAGLAYRAASRGKKVLVLTVDPSRRLATTLGLDPQNPEIAKVPDCEFELYASLIHPQYIFDQFVRECAPDVASAERLLKNKLYIQLSTTLSGSQEFTALNMLFTSFQSQEFDLIVLDTPPAQHAVDFFEAPQKIHDIFESNITQWFVRKRSKNPLYRLFDSGTSQVIGLFEKLTGSEFMSHVYDFFVEVQPLQQEIQKRTIAVQRMLSGQDAAFVLVTCFDGAKLKEALALRDHILKNGYNLASIVINRAHPDWFDTKFDFEDEGLRKIYSWYHDYYSKRIQLYDGFAENLKRVQLIRIPEVTGELDSVSKINSVMGESF